jgi:long-chain-alcohol oxidase
MRRECHPLLRGGRNRESKYNHGLSSAEMESLSSLCETILPSLSPIPKFDGKQNQPTKAVQAFYRASASQTPMPDEV